MPEHPTPDLPARRRRKLIGNLRELVAGGRRSRAPRRQCQGQ